MAVRQAGLGPRGLRGERGEKGDAGNVGQVGPIGPAGASGMAGAKGDPGSQGQKGDKGDQGSVGPVGPQGIKGDTGSIGPQGPAGAPAPTTGRLEFVGNVTISESALVSLALGMKRINRPLAGVGANDRLTFAALAGATNGCEAVNVYPNGAGSVTIAYYTPALGLAASYTIPIAVFRIT